MPHTCTASITHIILTLNLHFTHSIQPHLIFCFYIKPTHSFIQKIVDTYLNLARNHLLSISYLILFLQTLALFYFYIT